MFVAPAAFAQTTVTITGKLMGSAGNYTIGGRAAGSTGAGNEAILRDESSRIIFLVREDLGGGLAAIGKFDLRPSITDTGAMGNTGESYVGLTSPTWGTIALGRFDFHYGSHASYTGTHGGLMTNPTAVFDVAAAGTVALANQTRTNNSIRYGSPKWGDMFEIVVGYSSNPTAASTTPAVVAGPVGAAPNNSIGAAATYNNQNESDLRSPVRKGSAWNIAPKLWGKNWEAGYSYWTAKPDLAIATNFNGVTGVAIQPSSVVKMRGDSLYGTYVWGGFRVGLAWNRSKIDSTALAQPAGGLRAGIVEGATTPLSKRTTWGIPLAYTWGNHNIYADFYRARADKAPGFAGLDTKANFVGLTYAYDMSKRTTAAVSYSRIRNGAAASYNLFAAATPGGSLVTNPQGVAAGEDPRYIAVTLQHRF
jgi:predicted porin